MVQEKKSSMKLSDLDRRADTRDEDGHADYRGICSTREVIDILKKNFDIREY